MPKELQEALDSLDRAEFFLNKEDIEVAMICEHDAEMWLDLYCWNQIMEVI